jgi:hypothetical protein
MILFGCVCCERIGQWMVDKRSVKAVRICERLADHEVNENELMAAYRDSDAAMREKAEKRDVDDGEKLYLAALAATWCAFNQRILEDAAWNAWHCAYYAQKVVASEEERIYQARVLCDLLGGSQSFRHPSWLTSTVLALATGIYEEKAFDRMPILADALQDAGCDNEEILNHCRQPGVHVKGCWVVDLLLNKK